MVRVVISTPTNSPGRRADSKKFKNEQCTTMPIQQTSVRASFFLFSAMNGTAAQESAGNMKVFAAACL